MCLFTNTKRMKVAKEDIKCYKRITFLLNGKKNEFVTPYQWAPVPKDVLFGKQEFSALGNLEVKKRENGEYIILGGVIHTYVDKMDACENQHCDELVVACIIPKGTKYIEGQDELGNKNIAAKTIKVNEGFKNEEELKKAAINAKNLFEMFHSEKKLSHEDCFDPEYD